MATLYNNNYHITSPFSDTCFQIACQANVEQTITIPGDSSVKYQAVFAYIDTSNVFVCKNATPVIPLGGSVGTQPYNDFRPEKKYVNGGDVIHFITPDTIAYIGVSLLQLQA